MEIQWLLDLVKALGVAGGPVFAVLWWLERSERREFQKEAKQYLLQYLSNTSGTANAISEVGRIVGEVGEAIKDNTSLLGKLRIRMRAIGE